MNPFTLLCSCILVAIAGGAQGCSRKKSGSSHELSAVPKVVLTDSSEGLLLTWLDEKGDFHIEQKVTDVPAVGRDLVRVLDPAHSELASGDRVLLADLRVARPDGTYSSRVAPRAEFDQAALERRQKHTLTLAAPSAAGNTRGAGQNPSEGVNPSDQPAVVMYGASWCGACREVAAYLRRKGVAYVEKDIEKDPNAAREMQAKLGRAGLQGGSIPVLDVRGSIQVGFNPRQIEAALARPPSAHP